MVRKNLLGIVFLTVVTAALVLPSCDELTTEYNETTLYDSTLGEDCLRCHSDDTDNNIIQPKGQWENSRHASPDLIEATVVLNGEEFKTNQSSCGVRCHTSEGFIYYAENGTDNTQNQPSVISCYTCHMPHTGNYGEWSSDTLRGYDSEIPLPLINGAAYTWGKSKQCAICHQAANPPPSGTGQITLTADWGPHYSAQADIVTGTGGYNFGTVNTIVTHTNPSGGLGTLHGCLICHYGPLGDEAAGAGYEFGEHTFRLENEQGQQYFLNCDVTGCHGAGEITDFYAYESIDSLDSLADVIADTLLSRGYLDSEDTSRVGFVANSQIDVHAAGILYNYLLYKFDGSRGVHNPNYMGALLSASVTELGLLRPLAAISASDTSICINGTVDFTDESSGNVESWLWDFGDGAGTSTVHNPSHAFLIGDSTFTVTLIATGPGGSDTAEVDITVIGAPTADFTADTVAGCNVLEVAFADASSDATTWEWDFGDGIGTSTEEAPTYSYTGPGSYAVSLIVTTECGADTTIKEDFIRIYDAAPVASFTVDPTTGAVTQEFTFTPGTTGVETYEWDFGDENTSTDESPTHTFEAAATYTVQLIVTNPCGSDTTTVEVIVTE